MCKGAVMRLRPMRLGAIRRLAWGLAALAGLLVGLPPQLQAQTREQVEERIETLLPVHDAAWEKAQKEDDLKRLQDRLENEVPTDTFMVGPFRVVARENQRKMATETFEGVLSEYEGMLEGGGAVFQPFYFEFQYARHPMNLYIEPDVAAGERVVQAVMAPKFFRGNLEEGVRTAIGRALSDRLPEEFGRWVNNEGLASYRGYEWYYRRFATVPSQAVRLCFAGELGSCWDAVGVREGDDLWKDLYTDADRREFVRSLNSYWRSSGVLGRDPLWDGCVDLGLTAACDALLKRRFEEPVIPLSGAFRASLTFRALQIGGQGSFLRLISDEPLSPRDRLAHAAGVDADSLMAVWRDEIMAARPSHAAGMGRAGATALGWILLLLFLAARSTRWRSG